VVSLAHPIRSASISGYLDLAKHLGLDGESYMREFGLSPTSLNNIDTLVPIDAVCQLLEKSAQESESPDFAIQLIHYRKFSNLGPVSLMLLDEPTPRAALETLVRYLEILNPSLRINIKQEAEIVWVKESLKGIRPNLSKQAIELAVGVMFKILQELIGVNWKPLKITFAHALPQKITGHLNFFECPVHFGESANAIVCKTQDLDVLKNSQKLGLDAYARRYLRHAISLDSQSPASTVKQLIEVLLPSGKCSSSQIAELLGVDRRTMQRYLLTEGKTYSDLLNEVRKEFAIGNMLRNDKSLVEITKLLGFSGQSAFGHWFKQAFGKSTGQWRQALND
jgi:AraC-like DNA-binding protein